MFRTIEPDLDNQLHFWLTALCRAHDQKISMRKVMGSEPKLQDFYRADEGFAQYVDRYEIAGADLKIRNSYFKWELERTLAIEEYARIKARGEVERDQKIAFDLLQNMRPGETMDDVIELLRRIGISEDIVKKALEQVRPE